MKNKTITNKKSTLNHMKLWLLSLFLFIGIGAQNVMAQTAIQYPLTVTSSLYASFNGIVPAVPNSNQDDYAWITALTNGSFTFNGTAYTNMYFSANGWVGLYNGTAPAYGFGYTPLSTTMAGTGPIFAPFGRDLDGTTGGSIFNVWTGSEYVIEWRNFYRWNSVGEVLNFQIRLNPTTGSIRFHYGPTTASASAIYPQVGIKTLNTTTWATEINNLRIDNVGSNTTCTWANAVTGNSATSTMYLNSAAPSISPTNVVFTFNRVATTPNPVRTFAPVAGITGSAATLSWTAPVGGAASYNVQYRLQGACAWTDYPLNPVVGTTVNLSGLLGSSVYQYRVQAQSGPLKAIFSHVPNQAGTGDGYTGSGSFTTACTPVTTFPYVESFGGALPACWTNTSAAAALWSFVASDAANGAAAPPTGGGSSFARVNVYNIGVANNPLNLSTRAISLDATPRELKYWAWCGAAGNTANPLRVLISTDGGATFPTTLYTHTVPGNTTGSTWVQNTINLSAYINQANVRIRFQATSNFGNFSCNIGLDEVTVQAIPSCNSPSAPNATAITSNSATLNWTAAAPAPASGYQWEVRTSGSGGSGGVGLTTSGSVGAGVVTASTGATLAPFTTYSLWVRSNCSPTFSIWLQSANFTTQCASISAFPFNESFETASTSRQCWSNQYVTGLSNWFYATGSNGGVAGAQSGSLNARFASQSGVADPVTKLVSPTFNLTSLTTPRLKFWISQTNWTGDQNTAKVFYRTAPANPWVQILNLPAEIPAWTEQTIVLPSPSATYQIAFEGTNNWGYATVIDNVTIEETPSCGNPSAAAIAVASLSTANLSWTAPSPAPASGYEWEVRTSGSGGSGAGGLTTSGATGAGVTSAVASGLVLGQSYTLWVRSNCGVPGFSAWISSGTLTFNYCFPVSNQAAISFGDYISNVTISNVVTGFNNTSLDDNTLPYGYQDFTSISCAQAAGFNVNFSISSTTGLDDHGKRIWVDWNNDLDFNDAGEAVYTSVGQLEVVTGSFLVPALQPLGSYRMRVMSVYFTTGFSPCSTNDYSEAEDYTFNVVPAPTCFPVTLNAPVPLGPAFNTANISWIAPTQGTSPAGYEYVINTSPIPPVGAGTPTASTSVSGVPCTPNVVNWLHVRSDCGSGDFSVWVSISFQAGYCPAGIFGTAANAYISNVQSLGAFTNINFGSSFTAGGYQDHTGTIISEYVGEAFTLLTSYGDPTDQLPIKIWVDWNNDADFADLGEEVFSFGSFIGPVPASITVPPGTSVGAHRMRIRVDGNFGTPAACGTVFEGEVEDYTLSVLAIPACGTVLGTFATTYTTTVNNPLSCSGQNIILTQSPIAPIANGITYRLESSPTIGFGAPTTVATGSNNEFTVPAPVTGLFYRILTLCSGTPLSGTTWIPDTLTIADPVITSTTGNSNCGPASMQISATASPAQSTIVWYANQVGGSPLETAPDFTTPLISSTTSYWAQAQNITQGKAIVGTGTSIIGGGTANSGVTPFGTYWEGIRMYYVVRASELSAANLTAGNITSLTFDVDQAGTFQQTGFKIRISNTTANDVVAGFATPVTGGVDVYGPVNLSAPTPGLFTINFSTPFNWNGISNIVVEICHENDPTAICAICYGANGAVRASDVGYTAVYGKYADNVVACGASPAITTTSTLRPNMRFGGTLTSCAVQRVEVQAQILTPPTINPIGDALFAPTVFSFSPVIINAVSPTSGAVVTYTPASSAYSDANVSTLYLSGTDVNNVTTYFAPLTTTGYAAVATAPNGCQTSENFTITVDQSGIPNNSCSGVLFPVTNTLNFTTINTAGAVPGLGLPCGGIANQVWLKAIVPASGEVHVATKSNGISLNDITKTNVALFTGANCVGMTNVACDNSGGAGFYSYTSTTAPLTPGDTVYIRVSGLDLPAPDVKNGFVKIAVTSHLIWAPTNLDNANAPENWHGGDATALTLPNQNRSILIPANAIKPRLTSNTTVRGVNIQAPSPYFFSPGIDLNSFTLNVKGNWNVGPGITANTTLNCNGSVEFNSINAAPQLVTGRTIFGNLSINNNFGGVSLNAVTGVTCVLTSLAGNLNTNGNLVLKSISANSAALVNPVGGSIIGDVTVERKIGATSGYHYLSSAVAGATLNNTVNGWRDDFTINAALSTQVFIPGTNYSSLATVWQYDETNANPSADYGWISATGLSEQIVPLKGFACVVPANVTVDVKGPLNNNIIPGGYSVTKVTDGLNLIGNPYASPISWTALRALPSNVSTISPAGYQTFITSGGYAGGYATYGNGISSPPLVLTDKIASSQAFLITALQTGNINTTNAIRQTSAADVNINFFSSYSSVPDLIRLEVQGNSSAAEMVVYFDASSQDAFNPTFDSKSLTAAGAGVPTVYSLVENNNLAINVMGQLNLDKVVPMGINIKNAGTYNIVATDMTSFAPSVIAYLEDTQAGTMTNLRTNPSYSVTLPVGEINNRFFLHFHPAVELNAINETCAGNDGKLVINYPTSNTVNVVIKDANGNVVNSQNNVSGLVTINNLVAGNYVAEMTFGVAPNTYSTSDYFTVAGGNAVYANLSASANTVDMAANTTVNFTATAQGATSFNWNFGDGTVVTNGPANMSHTFAQAGTYNVTFEASNGICNTVATTTVEVTNATGLTAIANSNLQVIGVGSKVTVRFGNNLEGSGNIEVINMLGEVVAHLDNVSMKGTREIEMSSIAAGQYMVKITNNNKLYTEKVYLSRQ